MSLSAQNLDIDSFGQFLVMAAGRPLFDGRSPFAEYLVESLLPTDAGRFEQELFIFALLPFHMAVAVDLPVAAPKIQESMLLASWRFINECRQIRHCEDIGEQEWRAIVKERFDEYLNPSVPAPNEAPDPVGRALAHNLGGSRPASGNVLDRINWQFALAAPFAMKTIEQVQLKPEVTGPGEVNPEPHGTLPGPRARESVETYSPIRKRYNGEPYEQIEQLEGKGLRGWIVWLTNGVIVEVLPNSAGDRNAKWKQYVRGLSTTE